MFRWKTKKNCDILERCRNQERLPPTCFRNHGASKAGIMGGTLRFSWYKTSTVPKQSKIASNSSNLSFLRIFQQSFQSQGIVGCTPTPTWGPYGKIPIRALYSRYLWVRIPNNPHCPLKKCPFSLCQLFFTTPFLLGLSSSMFFFPAYPTPVKLVVDPPIWKIFIKTETNFSPKFRGENKKHLKQWNHH